MAVPSFAWIAGTLDECKHRRIRKRILLRLSSSPRPLVSRRIRSCGCHCFYLPYSWRALVWSRFLQIRRPTLIGSAAIRSRLYFWIAGLSRLTGDGDHVIRRRLWRWKPRKRGFRTTISHVHSAFTEIRSC